MKLKSLLVLLIFLGLVFSLYFLSTKQHTSKPETKNDTAISLRLKWITTAGFAGDYLAAQTGGSFEQQGLKVSVRTGGPQANPISLVASGSDDFGVTGADGLLLARANDVPIVAIAAAFQRNASGFIVKTNKGLLTPDQWSGKKVGIIAGNDTETVYRALLKKLGIDRSKISEVSIGFSLTPFLTDQIDIQPGYMTNQPILLKDKGIDISLIDPSKFGVSIIGNVYFTTEEKLRNHPDQVRSFLKGVISAWDEAIINPDKAVKALLSADPKLNADNQKAILAATIPFVKRADGNTGFMDQSAWQQTHDTLVSLGILKKKIEWQKAYTNDFLND